MARDAPIEGPRFLGDVRVRVHRFDARGANDRPIPELHVRAHLEETLGFNVPEPRLGSERFNAAFADAATALLGTESNVAPLSSLSAVDPSIAALRQSLESSGWRLEAGDRVLLARTRAAMRPTDEVEKVAGVLADMTKLAAAARPETPSTSLDRARLANIGSAAEPLGLVGSVPPPRATGTRGGRTFRFHLEAAKADSPLHFHVSVVSATLKRRGSPWAAFVRDRRPAVMAMVEGGLVADHPKFVGAWVWRHEDRAFVARPDVQAALASLPNSVGAAWFDGAKASLLYSVPILEPDHLRKAFDRVEKLARGIEEALPPSGYRG